LINRFGGAVARFLTSIVQRAIFSAKFEDEARIKFFPNSTGFFVEVGANDPVKLSQTYTLELAGWAGILIEPLPEMARRLRSQRSARVFEYACCSPAQAGKTATLFVAGIYSSLKPELPTPAVKPTTTISVETRELDQVLNEAGAPAPIDFISIDVEGLELDVLDGFSLEKWKPKLLVVEDRAIDFMLHQYISKRGYRWIKRFGINNWYVPAESFAEISWLGKLQYLNKFYLGLPLRRFRRRIALSRRRMPLAD
jgi:FkbM family methyltransferase